MDLLALKSRKENIQSIVDITGAMQIISTVMIGKAQKLLHFRRRILTQFDRLYYLRKLHNRNRESDIKVLIVFFSEKGFCATYNNQLLPLLSRIKDDYTIILVGTEGKQILSNLGCKWDFFSPSCRQLPDEEDGCDVFEYLKVLQFPQTVKILVNQYVSMFQQKPVIVDLIPELKDIYTSAYMEEDLPKVQIDAHIMESFIKYRLNYFYIENFLGEMSSKFMIMRSASDNAKKVKDNVVKELHKLKQQKMTQELSEIITSYRLLKSERNKNGKRR